MPIFALLKNKDSIMKANVNLQPYNSFGISAIAKQFIEINNSEDIVKLIRRGELKDKKILILGGGNNILLTDDVFDGIVIRMNNKGIKQIVNDGNKVVVRVQAGEDWPSFVAQMVAKGLYGVENLAHIPGTVGAAPIQNIGAYGMELEDCFVQCETINLESGKKRTFDNKECVFGYRSSIFKTMLRGQYVITSVDIKLSKQADLKLDYGNLKSYLEVKGIENPTLQQLHDAICNIRDAKLPDPKKTGNAGSFFKNPIVDKATFEDLKARFQDIPSFVEPNGKIKIPAGWLIEQCGWKGLNEGNVGVYDKQALVLVNNGGGTGKEIVGLAEKIVKSVNDKFGIKLQAEVNFV